MAQKKFLLFLLLSLFVACAWAKPPKPPHHGMAPPPPPPSPYAHIHFDMGHGMPKVDVDCGAQTSIKDCADVVNALLAKAADMRPGPPKPPKPPKP